MMVLLVNFHSFFEVIYDLSISVLCVIIFQAASRLLHHEYQFLHDQPIRYQTPGRVAQTHYHDVLVDGPTTRMSSIHGSEKLPSVDGVRGHRLRVCHVSQEDREGNSVLCPPGDDHSLQPRESFANIRMDAQQGSHPFIGLEDSSTLPDGTILHDTSDLHVERKRKVILKLQRADYCHHF